MLPRTLAWIGGAVFIYSCAGYSLALEYGRADVADVAWGPGILLAAALSFWLGGAHAARGLLVTALTAVWAARLSAHIHARNHGKPEDYRYRKWREEWGSSYKLRAFLQVFMLQGALMLVVALPVVVTNLSRDRAWGVFDLLGALVWMAGFAIESVADAQLARFAAEPANKGRLIQTGLWSWSRHPNYFGEVLLWWGLALVALPLDHGTLGLLGAGTITFFILKISGIPMLEERMRLKPGFDDYARRTSAFFPLPPGR